MALGITTGVATTAVVVIADVVDDRCSTSLGTIKMDVGVGNDDVGTLGADAADRSWGRVTTCRL